MAAVVVTDRNIRLDDAETSTDWGSIGGGAGGALETDFKYQDTNCFARKGGTALRGIFLSDNVDSDLSGAGTHETVMFKFICTTPGLLDLLSVPGMRLEIGSAADGSASTDFYFYNVQGSDAYPIDKSWLILPIDPNVEAWRDGVTGTPDLTVVDFYALEYDQVSVSKSPNQALDAVDIGDGLNLVGGDGADTEGAWQDFVDDDEGDATAGRFGYVITQEGIIFAFGKFVVGRTDTGSVADPTEFSDILRTLVFPGGLVDVGFNALEFDCSNLDTIITLNTITVEGRGRSRLKKYFDTELEVIGGATDTITIPAHGFSTGELCRYSIEGGTVLGGLTDDTDFFVRRVDVDTIAVFAVGSTVGRQNAFTDTSRVSLTAASAGSGENHSLVRNPDIRPDLIVQSEVFVAVSEDGTDRVMTSSDGNVWATQSASSAKIWRDVTFGNGLFVAVNSAGGDTTGVMTSPDGVSWTDRTSAGQVNWDAVTFGDGLFVAVGSFRISGTLIMTSPNGIDWTGRTDVGDTNQNWVDVAYGNDTYVAVASDGTNRVMTSDDGFTWVLRPSSDDTSAWRGVTYGNGLFVAVAAGGTDRVMTSPDGITWTGGTITARAYNDVAFFNGHFVAVAGATVSDDVSISEDGINWTLVAEAESALWRHVIGNRNRFVAVSPDATDRVMVSDDAGETWVSKSAAQANAWRSVVVGDVDAGTFLAEGCVFNSMRNLRLIPNATLESTKIINSQNLDINGGTVTGCTIDSPTLPVGEFFLIIRTVADLENIIDSDFVSGGEGHAIDVQDAGTASYVGNNHTGYGPGSVDGAGVHDNEFDSTSDVDAGADTITLVPDTFVTGDPIFYSKEGGTAGTGLTDGDLYYLRRDSANVYGLFLTLEGANSDTNRIALTSTGAETHVLYSGNAAINNSSGGTVTINVSGGGDTPTIRNSNGSTTIINNNVQLTFTGLKENTEVRVYTVNTPDELVGVENATDGSVDDRSVTFSLAASLVVDIRFMNQDFIVPDRNSILDFTWPTTTTSIPITQVIDRTFSNPA